MPKDLSIKSVLIFEHQSSFIEQAKHLGQQKAESTVQARLKTSQFKTY